MNTFGLPLENPFTPAVTFLIWMNLAKMLVVLVGVGAAIVLIIRMRRFEVHERERHERTLELLFFVKEWLHLGKFVRDDTRANTAKVADKIEQQAEVVKLVVERVPDKVVEKIKEVVVGTAGNGDVEPKPPSGVTLTVRPTNPNPEGDK